MAKAQTELFNRCAIQMRYDANLLEKVYTRGEQMTDFIELGNNHHATTKFKAEISGKRNLSSGYNQCTKGKGLKVRQFFGVGTHFNPT